MYNHIISTRFSFWEQDPEIQCSSYVDASNQVQNTVRSQHRKYVRKQLTDNCRCEEIGGRGDGSTNSYRTYDLNE